MKLPRKVGQALTVVAIFCLVVTLAVVFGVQTRNTFAETQDRDESFETTGAKFVTFYDHGEKLIVRTEAKTVGEALQRADITLTSGDIVEPSADTPINADNYFINIYRSRPVIIKDGFIDKYLMTASYDPATIMREAGITVYDGDEIKLTANTNFLETGVANVYQLTRNGGRTITEEIEIPFDEETTRDPELAAGMSEVRQLGEVGRKKITYEVHYVNNNEVSRQIISEETIREPVARITAVGAKRSVPPEAAECADWARAAGISESEIGIAIDLIYHESGCRVDASNAHSGAYGIPQALPGSKMASAGADWETNPVTQIRWMIGYVKERYGGWVEAADWWYSHGWY